MEIVSELFKRVRNNVMLVKAKRFKRTIKYSVNGVITQKIQNNIWPELNRIGQEPVLVFFIGLKYLSIGQNQNHLLVTRQIDNHSPAYCWIYLRDNLTPQHC